MAGSDRESRVSAHDRRGAKETKGSANGHACRHKIKIKPVKWW